MNDVLRRFALVLTAVLAAGCDTPTESAPAEGGRPDVRAWVDGAAADALDSSGRFLIPPLQPPGGMSIISLERAGEFALAAIRNLQRAITLPGAEPLLGFMERTHGAPIDWDGMQLGTPIGYGTESPYEPLPDSITMSLRRQTAPYYVVGLWVDRQEVAAIAVSGLTTTFSGDEGGFLTMPEGQQGGAFRFLGVDSNVSTHHPLHPEEAVREVGLRTGARVVEVPVLRVPRFEVDAHGSMWELVLDREVELEATTGARIRSQQLYLASNHAGGPIWWFVPSAKQPTEDIVQNGDGRAVALRVWKDIPVEFVLVKPPEE